HDVQGSYDHFFRTTRRLALPPRRHPQCRPRASRAARHCAGPGAHGPSPGLLVPRVWRRGGDRRAAASPAECLWHLARDERALGRAGCAYGYGRRRADAGRSIAYAYGDLARECVVLGPGSIEQAHGLEEWVELAQLEKLARIYAHWWEV